MTKTKAEDARWAIMTLVMPQLTEWRTEGDAAPQAGSSLRDFAAALAKVGESRNTVLRVNLVLSL